jgi:aspartate 1-decarboxylase
VIIRGQKKGIKLRWFLRSKITHAIVKESEIDYIGSIKIDKDLIEKSGMMVGEKVLVVSNTSGARLETYIIPGKRGSGIIGMNGAAAHLIKVGEEIIIMGFELADRPIKPIIMLVDKENKFEKFL